MANDKSINEAPVESWDIDKIIPYENNNKKHPPEQVKVIAASIADQGLNDPITVDADGIIISGHGRLQAVRSLGWKKVPVRHLHMLTKNQADKLRIAANKTTGTDYDLDVLQKELERLSDLGESLSDLGFDERELDVMLSDLGEMNDESLTDDLDGDVARFDADVDETSKEMSGKTLPLAKAFGIKTLALKSQRTVSEFMATIQSKTGLTGEDALVAHMEAVLGD